MRRKKQYTYLELFNMKPNTKKFYLAQQRFFNLKPNTDVLKQIGKNRKTQYQEYKAYMTMTEVFGVATNESRYLSSLKERDFKMLSGDYLHSRAATYMKNYINSLKAMTINQKIIDYLEKNPTLILEGLLPEIDNYYVYISSTNRTTKGNKYKVNIDEATFFENQIIDILKSDPYNIDLGLDKKEDNK